MRGCCESIHSRIKGREIMLRKTVQIRDVFFPTRDSKLLRVYPTNLKENYFFLTPFILLLCAHFLYFSTNHIMCFELSGDKIVYGELIKKLDKHYNWF